MGRRYAPVHRVDHYEIGEGGRSDRLPRKALVCSCGVGFSVRAPLPGSAWLAVLRWYTLRNGLRRSGRRGIFKMYEKRGSSNFWNGLMVFWAFPKQNSTLSRRKLIKNWQTGMRNSFLEKVPHNSE